MPGAVVKRIGNCRFRMIVDSRLRGKDGGLGSGMAVVSLPLEGESAIQGRSPPESGWGMISSHRIYVNLLKSGDIQFPDAKYHA